MVVVIVVIVVSVFGGGGWQEGGEEDGRRRKGAQERMGLVQVIEQPRKAEGAKCCTACLLPSQCLLCLPGASNPPGSYSL